MLVMLNTYEETLDWIHSLLPFGIKPGLDRVNSMLAQLGHPEKKLSVIHIGGTNGKGSTLSFLNNMLQANDYHVGTFTSPYMTTFNERMTIDSQSISDETLVSVARQVKPLADSLQASESESPTEFEVITVMALLFFSKQADLDVVLLEVGLGGRLDATNVLSPLLSVITNVGYDHMGILGHSIEAIAYEKAGIIKDQTPVVTAAEKPEVLDVLRMRAEQKQAPFHIVGKDNDYERTYHDLDGEQFSFRSPSRHYQRLQQSMKGMHQVKNAATALSVLDILDNKYHFELSESGIRHGLAATDWPGRFEIMTHRPLIILDGAHNPESIQSLVETLDDYQGMYHIDVVFQAMRDKDINHMLVPLYQCIHHLIFTSFEMERAASGKDLYDQSDYDHKTYIEDWRSFLSQRRHSQTDDTLLVVTGSLYFTAAVRDYLMSLS